MKTRSLFGISRLIPVALFIALVASLAPVIPVYAAGIVVNSSADTQANDGICALREAIIAANIDARSGSLPGECAAGSSGMDSITFAGSYIITVSNQLPLVTTAITITGKGAGNTIIQAAARPNFAYWRVFKVNPTGNLTLDGVTVRYGRCEPFFCTVIDHGEPNGNGIYNSGTLTLTNSIITGNKGTGALGGGIYNNGGTVTVTNSTFSDNAGFYGGGIYNGSGTLTVTNSTFSGNSAQPGGGGGIDNGGTLTVTNSTFSDNAGFDGGGGIQNGGTLTVIASTISGNTAQRSGGGGIDNRGTVTVSNSTVSGNSALSPFGPGSLPRGGGISNFDGSLTVTSSTISGNNGDQAGGISSFDSSFDGIDPTILRNTIVSGNVPANCVATNTTITDDGNNLDSGSTCGWGTSNGSLSNTDPQLGPLASNGGPTQTMKLLAGSPAIDAGNPATCAATDQRGVLRPLGAGCDIGAYETSNGAGPDTVGVFRPSNGLLYLKNSNTTGFADYALNYGLGGDYPVVGDWDGDGTTTIGIYRNGTFFLRNENTVGFATIVFDFGQVGDQPIAGDWDGDGDDTIGVFRPSTAQFLLRNSNTEGPEEISFFLGIPGDVGIAGDWNGDGMDTTGVFRPTDGLIFLKDINDTGIADYALNYGLPGDKPVIGDWNYDGIDTIGIYRNGTFFLRNSNTNGFAEMVFDLGIPGDMPIAGNWDGVP